MHKKYTLDRRALLACGAASAATLGFGVASAMARSVAVGALKVTLLSDGHMMVDRDRLVARGPDPRELHAIAAELVHEIMAPRFSLNIVMVEAAGKRTLIDSGSGGTWVATAGKLGDAMEAAGIDPKTIDQVIFTHAHPDHLWGVIDDFDNTLRFPNARYVMPDAEFAFWMSPTAPEAAGAGEGVTAGARRVLKMLDGKLSRAKADSEIMPGFAYIDAKGHTPGQCAVLISSGTEHLLVAADTLFHPVISVRHPDWQPAQDMDGPAAAATRKRLLDVAATRQALVSAYHIATPGLGRIARADGGFVWRAAG